MKKEGLSGIITVILIILISIIGISIVWLFVQPAIVDIIGGRGDGGEYNRFVSCTDLNLEAESCSYNETDVDVIVTRGAGSQLIDNLVFQFPGNVFSLNDGSGNIPDEFGSASIRFSISLFSLLPENAKVTAILDSGQACQFDDLPVRCEPEVPLSFECGNNICEPGEEITCPEDCGQLSSCQHNFGIVRLNDFEDECTRIRNGLINSDIEPIPNIGFHSVGASNLPATSVVGAKFHRLIVAWHTMYDENGQLRRDFFDVGEPIYRSRDTKILLTIRPNDPNRSTCGYEIGERGIDERDSYPKNESEWSEYVKFVVDKYYVQPVNSGQDSVIAGIQLGNEWSHQFVVNTTDNPTCNRNLMDQQVKLDSMIKLMNLTYSAMQEAQENLNPEEKRLPMLTFGVTGVDNFALKRGYNLENVTYNGFLENGVRINIPENVSESSVTSAERFIIESAPYYDYLDTHFRSNYYQDHGYIAQWIRDVWDENGITGKGLSSTEYGGPFYFYTTDYQEYLIPASLSHSLFQGFDAIAWASWVPARQLSAAANFGLEAMTTFDGMPRQYARNGYARFTGQATGYAKIMLAGPDTYIFLDSNDIEIGRINISENVPPIPLTYEQCSDGLDNDNDGLVDNLDEYCGDGYFNNYGGVDVEFNETGIYF